MKTFEFKSVEYESGANDDFSDQFSQLLEIHGQEGWDLKQVIKQQGWAIVIFSREINNKATRPSRT